MTRSWLSFVFMLFCMSTGLAVSQEKEQKEFGKTISEWIEILRKGDNSKDRRRALIALEYSAKAANVGRSAVLDATKQDKEKDADVRQHAVLLVGRLGPNTQGALRALIEALQFDKADQVREAAATALGTKDFLGQAKEFRSVLIEKLKDPHSGTRTAVVSTLRNLEKDAAPAVPALIESAKDTKEPALVRSGAVHIISRHGADEPKTLPTLIEIVNQSDNPTPLREVAIDGLGRLGGESSDAIAALGKALVEKDVQIRKVSAAALVVLGAKSQAAWPAAKTRFDKANEPDNAVRNGVIRLAGQLGRTNDEAVAMLTLAAEKDESNENRIAAIQELGELGSRAKNAIDALVKIQKGDGRQAIREAADKALTQIKTAS